MKMSNKNNILKALAICFVFVSVFGGVVYTNTAVAQTIKLPQDTSSDTSGYQTPTVGSPSSYTDSYNSNTTPYIPVPQNGTWQNQGQWDSSSLAPSFDQSINSLNGVSGGDTSGIPKATVVNESGAGSYTANKSNTGAAPASGAAGGSAQSLGACVGGQMLARLLTNAIGSAVGKLGKSLVSGAIETMTKVPITNINTEERRSQESEQNAHTGMFIFGVQTGVSWDSIAWCIVNTIIDYIINSTIAWANSGFKGNPAFIRNPGEFFKGLADQTAAQFIREVAYQTGGFDICKPFRAVIATGLASSYTRNQNVMSCSLTQMQQNMMRSSYTITTPTDWVALTRPQNNPYYSYIQAGSEMQKRIDVRNNTARFDLTINKGFLSQKKCKDPSKPESKTNPCDTTTPGSVIADSLSQTLNIPKQRLISAQRFDQMIDAIVNNLIKIALSKVLEGVTGQAPTAAVSSDYYSAVANNSIYGGSAGYNTAGAGSVGGSYMTGSSNPQSAAISCGFDPSTFIKSESTGFSSIDTDGTNPPPFNDPDWQNQTSKGGLNANTDNYVVNPLGQYSTQGGLAMGTKVVVQDSTSNRTACAIIGDNGSQSQWGEVSLSLASSLGIWTQGMGNSANSHNVTFSFYSR